MSRLSAIALAHSLLNSELLASASLLFSPPYKAPSRPFWQFATAQLGLCDNCLSGRFFRFAVGHVHYVLRHCCRVVPCEVACDRAKASPGFTPARESHVFLLIPRHHLQPVIRFQSSVHLIQWQSLALWLVALDQSKRCLKSAQSLPKRKC